MYLCLNELGGRIILIFKSLRFVKSTNQSVTVGFVPPACEERGGEAAHLIILQELRSKRRGNKGHPSHLSLVLCPLQQQFVGAASSYLWVTHPAGPNIGISGAQGLGRVAGVNGPGDFLHQRIVEGRKGQPFAIG